MRRSWSGYKPGTAQHDPGTPRHARCFWDSTGKWLVGRAVSGCGRAEGLQWKGMSLPEATRALAVVGPAGE